MSINSDEFFNLKKKYEEAKDNIKYWYRDDPIYHIEILKSLAAEWLSSELFDKEYLSEDEEK